MEQLIQLAYSILDQFNISLTGLTIIAALFLLAFLAAVREVACWFLKIGDLKKDLCHLQETLFSLEAEVRSLREKSAAQESPKETFTETRMAKVQTKAHAESPKEPRLFKEKNSDTFSIHY